MKKSILLLIFISLTAVCFSQEKNDSTLSSSTFNGLKFRSLGPAKTSGRITDIAVNPNNISEYYVASASGGVWKTTNSGTTFEPIFDKEGSYSIGCVTLDPNNPFVVWVGTGENNSQRSVSYGDGVYRSNDGGKTWKNMGLKSSEHIGKILIDPRNSNIIFVAAQGPLWNSGGDRGLYKSTDGGNNWKKVLDISDNTGVNDVVLDPRNPDVMYASSYQRRRHVYTIIDGGPESAIYKSTDGGETWNKLTNGLPDVDMGKIGLAVSPVNPDIVFAVIEAAEDKGGFFRSTDRGASWEKRSSYTSPAAQYYNEIFCDPKDVDRIYAMDTWLQVTNDGGKTFENLGEENKHVDNHAMWIDPNNTSHYLVGCDGGLYESFDRAEAWNFKSNLPVTQFYRVTTDNDLPFYNVYGGTQDNFSLGGPSQTKSISGITNSDWFVTVGGDGFVSKVDPKDPNIVYSESQYGGLIRYDKKSGEVIGIQPAQGKNEKPLRWNWDSPLIVSPHSHTRLYFAANKVFKSDDRGDSWKEISGDLTRQIDRNKLKVMGKMWSIDAVAKNSSTSFFGNIVSLSESPLKEGLLYAGTDDGLINVSRDDGKNWKRLEKFPGVPETTYVSYIIASKHSATRVYACFDNHKRGDYKPYIFRSDDNGDSWKSIAGNLPKDQTVYCIAEDNVDPDLLFAGTEYGVFFTYNGGKDWIQLKGGIPTIAVRDMAIQERENDLVLATFGRGFYILDNYLPLRKINKQSLEKENKLFPVKDAFMFIKSRPLGLRGKGFLGASFFTAENPPFGAVFTYYLKEKIKTKKEIRQEKEKEAFKKGENISYPSAEELHEEEIETPPYLLFTIKDSEGNIVRKIKTSPEKGINRINWNLRYSSLDPTVLKESEPGPFSEPSAGMLAMPGTYIVTLSKVVDGVMIKLDGPQTFEAKVLGETSLPAKDRLALTAFQNKASELNRAVLGSIKTAKDVLEKVEYIKKALVNTVKAPADLMLQADSIKVRTTRILRKLEGDKTLIKYNENVPVSILARIQSAVYDQWQSTSTQTKTQEENYRIAGEEFEPLLSELRTIVEVDLKNLQNKMEELNAPWTPGRVPDWKMR